jgi:hypothetical protein
MNGRSESPEPSSPATDSPAGQDLSRQRLDRRRLLLKGLAKGGVVAAAAAPVLANATVLTSTGHLCTVSGTMSAVRSVTGGSTSTCGGHAHTKYCSKPEWPDYNATTNTNCQFVCSGSGKTIHAGTSPACNFSYVFGGGTANSLWNILNGTAGTADERAWIAALLNARKFQIKNPGMNYPYSTAQVIAFYSSANAANALAMFKNHLQGML